MRSVIYTGSTGAGHTLAALSIQKALEEKGHYALVIDAFEEGGDFLNRTVSKGYQRLVENLPKLYKRLYHQFDSDSKTAELVLRNSMKILQKDLLCDMEDYEPDLIISTHPIVTNILGRLKDEGKIDKPILAFVTDYKIHEVYLRDSIDAYVVGSEYTKDTMIERGVAPEKVFVYGIPIREEFRVIKKRHNSSEWDATVLLMGGSLGNRHIKKAFIALLQANARLRIIAVCGNNKHMLNVLRQIARNVDDKDKDVQVLGFVDNISELMDESDAIVTKPGGLTSTEAISKGIPMIIPYTYPGQEEDNAKYLVEEGMAIETKNYHELSYLVDYLAQNPNVMDDISQNMSESASKFSIEETVELCERLSTQSCA